MTRNIRHQRHFSLILTQAFQSAPRALRLQIRCNSYKHRDLSPRVHRRVDLTLIPHNQPLQRHKLHSPKPPTALPATPKINKHPKQLSHVLRKLHINNLFSLIITSRTCSLMLMIIAAVVVIADFTRRRVLLRLLSLFSCEAAAFTK
eukprot:CAMPEP_0185853538 /NCGR_PEP_ID=MMETSP1354-20130828/19343_1 /TAXON_ID=708628 /ORGANISM="Erythrolobus madagascarensis, Strain CCMP3276" /LENGTH=146 /DNA_ID=CAMNT_0028555049 /DNA_START=210 /DNA_END=650 /DNA_ORIENTATION=+